MKNLLKYGVAVLIVFSANAQKLETLEPIQKRPLSTQKEFYIQGDAIAIGNNILSEQKRE